MATVLIVDDDRTNITMLAHVLEPAYDVLFAMSGEQTIELATVAQPDVILLDVIMPDMNGYEVLVKLKADPATASIPVIFLTGLDASAAEMRGFELGAADYITKPFNAAIVKARVHNHVELKQARDRLQRLASIDGLTGVANRRTLDDGLRRECHRIAGTDADLALVMADVDAFKLYNDRYGHVAGDECLRRIADTMAQSVHRSSDVVARYGGEEFACLLPETATDDAVTVARRIQRRLAELAIPHAGSPLTPYVTVSFGVAGFNAADGPVEETALVLAADAALYEAKLAGRNCIRSRTLGARADAARR